MYNKLKPIKLQKYGNVLSSPISSIYMLYTSVNMLLSTENSIKDLDLFNIVLFNLSIT
jgi:hypothetical protein